eukprot:TRINITY_DN3719_c0_g1_i17.p1 TRINITY_DN3719_c0_g1~~TRINITY_DN3719_c0_g1_i17.p1  ORF type:complete len:944 (+),score=186.00 TRINITY_DN3719_c0_g1_i17:291-3122(+)
MKAFSSCPNPCGLRCKNAVWGRVRQRRTLSRRQRAGMRASAACRSGRRLACRASAAWQPARQRRTRSRRRRAGTRASAVESRYESQASPVNEDVRQRMDSLTASALNPFQDIVSELTSQANVGMERLQSRGIDTQQSSRGLHDPDSMTHLSISQRQPNDHPMTDTPRNEGVLVLSEPVRSAAASSVAPSPFTETESRYESQRSMSQRQPADEGVLVLSEPVRSPLQKRSVGASSAAQDPFTETESRYESQRSVSQREASRVQSQRSVSEHEGTMVPDEAQEFEAMRQQSQRSMAASSAAPNPFKSVHSRYESVASQSQRSAAASTAVPNPIMEADGVKEMAQREASSQLRSLSQRSSLLQNKPSVASRVESDHRSVPSHVPNPSLAASAVPSHTTAAPEATAEERAAAVAQNQQALRLVKRLSLDDFDLLRSYVYCPPAFAGYCLALAALLAPLSPVPFRSPVSLSGSWRGLQGLLASPTILIRLLSACDTWKTSPQAKVFLAELEGAPVDPALQAIAPSAHALAEWTGTFCSKWVTVGRPEVPMEERREDATDSPRRGVVSARTALRRSRSTTPTGRRTPGGRASSRASSRARSGTGRQSPTASQARGREARKRWNFGTAGGNPSPVEQLGWRPRSPAGSPRRLPAADPATLEDRLLHALVDVRTLTPWDLSHLANHTPQKTSLSGVVQACVKATAALVGLAGPTPDDTTIDLWAVGLSALRGQPEEVLLAMRKLESSTVEVGLLDYVADVLPAALSPASPTPYLAVNVMRSWCTVMLEYHRARVQGHPGFAELPAKADTALVSLGFSSPPRRISQPGTHARTLVFTPPLTAEPPAAATPRAAAPAPVLVSGPVDVGVPAPESPRREGLQSPQRTPRGHGRRDLRLAAWLEDAGLAKYGTAFDEHEIDMESLGLLSEEDLVAMGLPIGPRRKVLDFVARRGH